MFILEKKRLYFSAVSMFSPLKSSKRSTHIQWNQSNPTHQGTREMCRIVQDVGILRFYFR